MNASKSISEPHELAPAKAPGETLMAVVLGGLASWSLLRYARLAANTLRESQALEWMEGGVLHTVQRLLDGEPLYAAPSVEYTAFIYPPVYFWLTALSSKIFGVDFFAGRIVSFLAILTCFALVFIAARRLTGRAWLGLLGAGCLAATFDVSGRWFHLARVDSLYQALLFAGFLVLVGSTRGVARALVAGVLFACAFLTKQTALVVIAPVLIATLLCQPGPLLKRSAVHAGAACAALVLPILLLLHVSSDGWSSYFLFEVAGQHPWAPKASLGYWTNDLWSVAVFLVLALIGLAALWQKGWKTGLPWLGLLVGVLSSTWLSRAHEGGAPNVVMPAFLLIAMLLPVGVQRVLRIEKSAAASLAWVAALTLQFLVLLLAWQATPISAEQRAQYQRFTRWIEEQQASDQNRALLIPDARWIKTDRGVLSNGMGMAAHDLLRIDPTDRGRLALEQSIRRELASGKYGAVVTSERQYLRPLLTEYYTFAERIEGNPMQFTGTPFRHRFVYRRN